MNVYDRLHHQLLNLQVCSEDLRQGTFRTDEMLREFVQRLRKIRHEGLWPVAGWGRSPADGYVEYDWAMHRLAVAVGRDLPLSRHHDEYDGVRPADVATVINFLRDVEGR